MELINLFAVTSNTDLTEGRGATIVKGYFRERHIAEATVRDRRYSRYCVMGVQSDRDVKYAVRDDTIRIYGSVEEFFGNTVEERKKRAIAKLTDDDLDALGLKR
jgi:hypothetical protein